MATTSQPARDLALALTSVMNGTQGPDSKLQHAIERLAGTASRNCWPGPELTQRSRTRPCHQAHAREDRHDAAGCQGPL
eukprot:1251714-Pyramimonas_sp.AAC.1